LILLTTSRRPTGRIRAFCRDLANCIPNVVRINRGKMSLDGVAEKAIDLEADRIIIVERWHAGPGKINLFQVSSTGLSSAPLLMMLSGIRLRKEFEQERRRARSSVITVEPKTSPELEHLAEYFSQFFGLPLLALNDAYKRHRSSIHFSFDSSQHVQITFMHLEQMVEIGPRLTISKLIWEVPS
jgi:U3 small nucleolar ribonucleoprotein protein IMP4